MTSLTTHILDTASGRPAAGVQIEVFAIQGERVQRLATAISNADGRTDRPILSGDEFRAGRYELAFHVGAYFARTGAVKGDPPFLDIVPVRFGISDPRAHYHVPLLVSPWSYATYRGS